MKSNKGKKGGGLLVILAWLLVVMLFSGCGSDGTTDGAEKAKDIPKEKLEAGTYTGVMVVTEAPLLVYAEKAVNDPASVSELVGPDGESCEELDLNDEEVRAQVDEAIVKGKAILNVDVPLVVVITEGADGLFSAVIRADFQAAFPDYGCEEAEDQEMVLTHSLGQIKMETTSQDQEVTTMTIFEGLIEKGGLLKGEFRIETDSPEYLQYTETPIMMSGTWEVTK